MSKALMKRIHDKEIEDSEYVPELIGMRPLENGRLALAFWNEKTRKEEVRIYDVWKAHPKDGKGVKYLDWYDPVKFKQCYLYMDMIWWEQDIELSIDHIYYYTKLVKEDFQKLI